MEKNHRIYLIIALILIITMVVLWRVLSMLGEKTASHADPMSKVPKDAVLVLQVRSDVQLMEKLLNGSILWQDARNWKEIDKISLALTEIVHSIDSLPERSPFNDQQWIVSFHPHASKSLKLLLVKSLKTGVRPAAFQTFLSQAQPGWGTEIVSHQKQDMFLIKSGLWEETLRAGIRDGLLLMSTDSLLLHQAMHLHELQSLVNDKGFASAYQSSGKKALCNVYLSLSGIQPQLRSLFSEEFLQSPWLAQTNGWASMDLEIRDKLLFFTGTLNTLTHQQSPFDQMQTQEPAVPDISGLIPTLTNHYFSIAIPDLEKHLQSNQKKRTASKIDSLNQVYNIKALSSASLLESTFPYPCQIILLEINTLYSESMPDSFFKKKTEPAFLENSFRPAIYPFHNSNQLFEAIGSPFANKKANYFAIKNNVIIAAEDSLNIFNYFRLLAHQKPLNQSKAGQNLASILPERYSLRLFANPHASRMNGRQIFAPEFLRTLYRHSDVFARFDALALNAIPSGTLWHFTLAIHHNPEATMGLKPFWEYPCDTLPAHAPILVKNHISNEPEILLIDLSNQIYLFNMEGKLHWKKKIPMPVLSPVYQVDYYKNGRLQYLFNTSEAIYLIDRNGETVEGFPVKLPEKTSSPMAVFDYDGKRDYRIVLPFESLKIRNFDIRGKEQKGWENPVTKHPVHNALQHIRLQNFDYLLAVDTFGTPYIFNRRGQIRIKIPEEFKVGKHARFFQTRHQNTPSLVIAGQNGKLAFINTQGKLSTQFVDSLQANVWFRPVETNQKGKLNYLFAEEDMIRLYQSEGRLIWSRKFDSKITNSPLIWGSANNLRILVFFKDAQELTMLDANGKTIPGFPVPSNTQGIMVKEKTKTSIFSVYQNALRKFSVD